MGAGTPLIRFPMLGNDFGPSTFRLSTVGSPLGEPNGLVGIEGDDFAGAVGSTAAEQVGERVRTVVIQNIIF